MPDMITTAEELEAIPSGWIVRSADGSIACRFDRYRGVTFGDERPFMWSALSLPVQVIWRPDVDLVRLAGAEALRDTAEGVPVDLWATYGRTPRRSVEGFQDWLRERADRLEKEARG